jgi:hypothetical protein
MCREDNGSWSSSGDKKNGAEEGVVGFIGIGAGMARGGGSALARAAPRGGGKRSSAVALPRAVM